MASGTRRQRRMGVGGRRSATPCGSARTDYRYMFMRVLADAPRYVPERSNARPFREDGGSSKGTLCPNHAIVCPMIARQSSTAVEISHKDDARESLLVGAEDETSSTMTINVGCLIFA